MDTALTILLAAIAGGLFGFFGNLVSAKLNKPKITAETKKLISDTNGVDQEQFLKWVEKYESLYKQLEKERKDRDDEKRGERLSRDKEREEIEIQIRDLKNEVLTVQIMKGAMIAQITNLQNESLEKDKIIARIEKENVQLRELVQQHGIKIDSLTKKVTGQLPPR